MTTADDKLKILAVDDNKTNLHILQVFLKKQGHEVILGENGEEAVALFQKEKPDVVLLDIMMPVMNGFDAARRIKSLTPDRWVPIIFLSALNRDENLIEGLECGADDYMTKPINFVVLEAKLRTMQRSLRLQQQAQDALNRVQAISDNVIDAIVTIDKEGMILSVNRATERIFGWPATDLIGNNVNCLMPEPYHSAHDGYLARYLQDGEPRIIGRTRELIGLRKDGNTFPMTLGVSAVSLEEQEIYVGVVRDITETKAAEQKLRENARQLQVYYDQTESEQQLAMRLMERQLHRPGLKDPLLSYHVLPAENFSGDAVAATRSESGRLYALLADATGHGLTAAISVLPVLTVFYRLAKHNRSLTELVLEFNQQLKESMPIGRFVAATIVCVDPQTHKGEIWVGGTPDVLLVDRWGRVERTFVSDNLALGILGNAELDPKPISFDLARESQLVLFSDGLIEAESEEGKQFGLEGLIGAMANNSPQTRFDAIRTALTRHLNGQIAADDVSLLLIDCP